MTQKLTQQISLHIERRQANWFTGQDVSATINGALRRIRERVEAGGEWPAYRQQTKPDVWRWPRLAPDLYDWLQEHYRVTGVAMVDVVRGAIDEAMQDAEIDVEIGAETVMGQP